MEEKAERMDITIEEPPKPVDMDLLSRLFAKILTTMDENKALRFFAGLTEPNWLDDAATVLYFIVAVTMNAHWWNGLRKPLTVRLGADRRVPNLTALTFHENGSERVLWPELAFHAPLIEFFNAVQAVERLFNDVFRIEYAIEADDIIGIRFVRLSRESGTFPIGARTTDHVRESLRAFLDEVELDRKTRGSESRDTVHAPALPPASSLPAGSPSITMNAVHPTIPSPSPMPVFSEPPVSANGGRK